MKQNQILVVFGGMGMKEFHWMTPDGFQRSLKNSDEFGISVRQATIEEIETFGKTAPFTE